MCALVSGRLLMRNCFDRGRVRWVALVACMTIGFQSRALSADTVNEFWPEVDSFVTLSPTYRLVFMAARAIDRDSRQGEGEFGASFDISLKPILRMKLNRLNPEERKYLTFRAGYRYLTGQNGPAENRMILEATPRFPMPKSFLVADRNRIDLRWRSTFSWRYRNRLTVEKSVAIRSFSFTPYVRSEIFYDSTVSSWNRLTYSGGVVFPIKNRAEIEPSFERQNISGSSVNHVNGAGLTLSLYF
jgi:hypothetical protein